MVTSVHNISREIAQRIASGWRGFGEYSHFLKDREIPICSNKKITDTVILPAMNYGAEQNIKKRSLQWTKEAWRAYG